MASTAAPDPMPGQTSTARTPLLAMPDASLSAPHTAVRTLPEPSTRARLAALLASELDFHGKNGNYASHHLHAFAARFPPQLPRLFIDGLTAAGDIVLDPMMGSGTALVEARLAGRRGIGLDLDPLALRLCHAKTLAVSPERLRDAAAQVVTQAAALAAAPAITRHLARRFNARTQAFVDYWFLPATQRELLALILAIESITEASVRRFLELTFSSIIITRSGGVTLARDLAHSRPHLDTTKVPKNALEQFAQRLHKNLAGMVVLSAGGAVAAPLAGDARAMPLADDVIDLIVTSPPYANALDYMRAHKFSLVWLGQSVEQLSGVRAAYIGSERVKGTMSLPLPERPERVMHALAAVDKPKSAMLTKYFADMRAVLAEMYRVLHQDAAAVVVVGPSVMRGINVQTHQCLADIAAEGGFEVVGIVERRLDRNKRMMPARFRQTDAMIEQRMHAEYVLGLWKPAGKEGHGASATTRATEAVRRQTPGVGPHGLHPSAPRPTDAGRQGDRRAGQHAS